MNIYGQSSFPKLKNIFKLLFDKLGGIETP